MNDWMWISKRVPGSQSLLVIMASEKYASFNFGKEFFAVESKFLRILSIVASYVKSKCRALPKIKIEGLHAKRAYIEFWPIFSFCRIELIFGRLTCFDLKSIVP